MFLSQPERKLAKPLEWDRVAVSVLTEHDSCRVLEAVHQPPEPVLFDIPAKSGNETKLAVSDSGIQLL